MLRAILFDYNGVLVDDEPLHHQALARVLGEEGVAFSWDEFVQRGLGRPDRACFREVMESHGRSITEDRILGWVERKARLYREAIGETGPPLAGGALSLVEEAFRAGVMLGVVSGALRAEVEQGLERSKLRDCFKIVVAAEDVERGKPDPQGYRRGVEQLNGQPPFPERLLHPHEVLAIEDTPAGLEAAAAAGLARVGVGHTLPVAKLQAADLVAERLEQLSLLDLQKLFAEPSRR